MVTAKSERDDVIQAGAEFVRPLPRLWDGVFTDAAPPSVALKNYRCVYGLERGRRAEDHGAPKTLIVSTLFGVALAVFACVTPKSSRVPATLPLRHDLLAVPAMGADSTVLVAPEFCNRQIEIAVSTYPTAVSDLATLARVYLATP